MTAPPHTLRATRPARTKRERWWSQHRAALPLAMILSGVAVTTAVILILGVQVHRVEVVRDQTLQAAELATGQRDALAVDVDALRTQVQSLGQRPVAPPADTTVQNAGPTATALAVPSSSATVTATVSGPRGEQGRQGLTGASATPAPSPSAGASGATGPQGPAGEPGASGAAGSDGADGVDGQPGVGIPGSAGPAGSDGRGVAAVRCEGTGPDSAWVITYTDGSESSVTGPCRLQASQEPSTDPAPRSSRTRPSRQPPLRGPSPCPGGPVATTRPPLPDDQHKTTPGAPEPAPGEYADPADDIDWDVTQQGRMREHADETPVATERWVG